MTRFKLLAYLYISALAFSSLEYNFAPNYNFIELTHNNNVVLSNEEPSIYALNSIDELSNSEHMEKLSNTKNIFYFKSSQSSLQYNHKYQRWVEIIKQDKTNLTIQSHHSWLPATQCLSSTFGDGGYVRKEIYIDLDITVENYIDLHLGFIPVGFSIGLTLSMAVRVGFEMTVILLFGCDMKPNEVVQMVYKPNWILIPRLKFIEYKIRKRKLRKSTLRFSKPFKMLVIDSPQHKCIRSADFRDLMCDFKDIRKQTITLDE